MLQGIKIANTDHEIQTILSIVKNIAVVGSSPSPDRDSYRITKYLIDHGYNVFPINPNYNELLNVRCYPSLKEISETIELVNVFRRPEYALDVTKEAVDVGTKVIWYQFGVASKEAVNYALVNKLTVVQNRCIKIEHERLISNVK